MVCYKQGKIYMIQCNITNKKYIGSTCKKKINQRLIEHKSNYKKYKEVGYLNYSVFSVLENNNFDIYLLEEYPCETKEELLQKEREYIEENECVNKIMPIISSSERLETMKKYSKKYYYNNKMYYKNYYENYYDENKNKIKFYQKRYKLKYKNQLEKRGKELIKCECGRHVTRWNLGKHKKTKKHLSLVD